MGRLTKRKMRDLSGPDSGDGLEWALWLLLGVLALALLAYYVAPGVYGQTLQPCTSNPAEPCHVIPMTITREPRAFTPADFNGQPLAQLDEHIVCAGRLSRGRYRYFVDGTAPSALIGTLVPSSLGTFIPQNPDDPTLDPSGTLEDGDIIMLYNRALVLGFKAVQADSGGAELVWECNL